MAQMFRVTTILGGPYVQGGGIQQFYFTIVGGSPTQAQTAVKTFWAAFAASLGSGTTLATNAGIEQLEATDGHIIAVLPGTAGTTTCTGGAEVIPMHAQGILQLRTGAYSDGREIRGRVNIPASLEASNSAGAPIGAYQTTVSNAGAALVADANSELVVWRRPRVHRLELGSPGQPGYRKELAARDGEYAVVTTATCATKWGSLRSRRD